MLFPKALFLAAIFQTIEKNSIFLLNFQNFLKEFPTNWAFRQNAQNPAQKMF